MVKSNCALSPEAWTIETERLLLRPFTLDDATAVAALANNRNLSERTLYLPHPYTEQSAIDWIATHADNFRNDERYEFAITDRETGTVYGAIGLSHNKIHRKGSLGYWIGEPYWGNGYATEAALALVHWAFSVRGFHKVYASHFDFNQASGRVMQKIGMNLVGTLVDNLYKDGKYITEQLYEIVHSNTK